MSDAVWFVVLFGGFFVLRCIAATIFFLMILPVGVRCPHCDAVTVRVQSRGWNLLMPWFRTSWCLECGWDGLLRNGGEQSAGTPGSASASSAIRDRETRRTT
jgi:hypothetical protein